MGPTNPYEVDDQPLGEPEAPTACELSVHGHCDGDAMTTVRDEDEIIRVCQSCADWWTSREPSDHQIMNGPGVEGGVRYQR